MPLNLTERECCVIFVPPCVPQRRQHARAWPSVTSASQLRQVARALDKGPAISPRPSTMARNYRGSGQRDPPGWGNSGQPAREFAFGGGGNQPGNASAQPQMQNRFQALQPAAGAGRGRGGAACFTCGQVGHLQRDCPSRRGGGGGGGAQKPVGAEAVVEDMRESCPWPFTCYAPATDGAAGHAGPTLLVGDVSFEEARAAAYSALATAGQAGAHACTQRFAEAAQWRQGDRRRLAAMPHAELRMQLQKAAEGAPAQAQMPQLDWSFPGGAAAPVAPAVVAPPQVYAAPQPTPSPFPFPAQQVPQQPAFVPQQFPGSPLPHASAAVASSAVPSPAVTDTSDAASWMAAGFRQGAIPETPPPPQFV